MTIGRRITANNTCTFTIRSGLYSISSWGRSSLEPVSSSTVSLGLINNAGWSIDASSGVKSGQLSGNYSVAVLGGVNVSAGATVTSYGGYSAYISGDKKVTENVRGGLALEAGMNGRLIFKVRYVACSQRARGSCSSTLLPYTECRGWVKNWSCRLSFLPPSILPWWQHSLSFQPSQWS